jgi:hypothetical protein
MADIFDQLGGQDQQSGQNAPAQTPAKQAGGDAFEQLGQAETQQPAAPPKSMLEHAKDTVSTVAAGLGMPSNKEEIAAANKQFPEQVKHPIQTVKDIANQTIESAKSFLQPNSTQALDEAKAAWEKGNHVEAARHMVNYLVPFVGGAADAAGDAVDSKEWGKAVGHTVNAILPFLFGDTAEKPITSLSEANRAASLKGAAGLLKTEGETAAVPKTTLRPTTTKVAGVEAPISAAAQENPSAVTKIAEKMASPGKAREFQQEQTAPAATKQLYSTIGQRAEDRIAQHDAIRNGEATPEGISGTHQVSKFQTPDSAAQAMKQAASKTWQTADELSQQEQASWEAQRDIAISEHKDAVEEHNRNVEEHNAALGPDELPMAKMPFNPSDAQIPEQPVKFSELQRDYNSALANAKSPDAVVRDKAINEDIPNADKALDNWFKQHKDDISPMEYDSAKRLHADSLRMQDVANKLRAPIAKSTLTGNTMRGIEASIDNQMIRRGQAPGAFKRLLGDDAYQNWRDVAKTFDPVGNVQSPYSWGIQALKYGVGLATGALTGHPLVALGGEAATEWMMNHILFDPEWGGWWKKLVNVVKEAGTREHGEFGMPGTVGQPFNVPDGLKQELDGLVKKYAGQNTVGTAEGATKDTAYFQKAKEENPTGSMSDWAQRAQQLKQEAAQATVNASGESSASQEAINRAESERAQGVSRVAVDTRSGAERPLTGVDAVDYQPQPYETVEFRGGDQDGQEIARGDKARPYTRRTAETPAQVETPEPTPVTMPEDSQYHTPQEGEPVRLPSAEERQPGNRVSQRNPTAIKAPEDALNGNLRLDLDAIKKADESKPGFMSKMAQSVAKYPGVKITPEEAAENPEKALNKFINHVADNLTWLHDQIPSSIRGISKLWYDSAHVLTKDISRRYGLSHEQVAGIVAALSPKNEWNNNIEIAKRVIDTYKTKQNATWTPEMGKRFAEIAPKNPDLALLIDRIRGKKLSELQGADEKAAWIRLYDESHNVPQKSNYAPDGSIRGFARNDSGSISKSSWSSLPATMKAVNMIEDGSMENIHTLLGEAHKIRNFYNNIIDPWNKSGDVTIDTHAVGAGHLRPMSQKSEEVLHNFGSSFKPTKEEVESGQTASSSIGNSVYGVNGTYALYAEAYRRAAAKLGILPRELQSITWEGIRSLYEAKAKTPELRQKIAQVWKDHKDGNVSIGRARQQIVKAAGGFKNPGWLEDVPTAGNVKEAGSARK